MLRRLRQEDSGLSPGPARAIYGQIKANMDLDWEDSSVGRMFAEFGPQHYLSKTKCCDFSVLEVESGA